MALGTHDHTGVGHDALHEGEPRSTGMKCSWFTPSNRRMPSSDTCMME